jgi:hypothetical protein
MGVIRILTDRGTEYCGSFNVRIDRRVHRALAIEATQAGVSLNALVAQRLAMVTISAKKLRERNSGPIDYGVTSQM